MATLTTRHGRQRHVPPITKQTPPADDAAASPAAKSTAPYVEPERRHAMICEAAYFLAERRSFCPGYELEDWLAAESDVDRALASESATPRGA